MEIFKNGVGRPSNETLSRRRSIKILIAIFVIAAVGIGGYYLYNTFNANGIESGNKNIQYARVFAEIHKPESLGYEYATNNETDQYNIDIIAYKIGSFKFKVDLYNATGKTVYYKVFTYNSSNYEKNAIIYKNCTATKASTTTLNISMSLSASLNTKAVKVKTYSSKSLCTADKTSNGKTGYGEGTSVAVFRLLLGDVATAPNYTTGDGKITQEDLDALMKYLSGEIKFSNEQKKAADINGDGKVNSKDLTALQKQLNPQSVCKYDLLPDVNKLTSTEKKNMMNAIKTKNNFTGNMSIIESSITISKVYSKIYKLQFRTTNKEGSNWFIGYVWKENGKWTDGGFGSDSSAAEVEELKNRICTLCNSCSKELKCKYEALKNVSELTSSEKKSILSAIKTKNNFTGNMSIVESSVEIKLVRSRIYTVGFRTTNKEGSNWFIGYVWKENGKWTDGGFGSDYSQIELNKLYQKMMSACFEK